MPTLNSDRKQTSGSANYGDPREGGMNYNALWE